MNDEGTSKFLHPSIILRSLQGCVQVFTGSPKRRHKITSTLPVMHGTLLQVVEISAAFEPKECPSKEKKMHLFISLAEKAS